MRLEDTFPSSIVKRGPRAPRNGLVGRLVLSLGGSDLTRRCDWTQAQRSVVIRVQSIAVVSPRLEETAEPQHAGHLRLRRIELNLDSLFIPVEQHAEESARHVLHK